MPCANADAIPGNVGEPLVRTATLCLLNQERTSRGLKPLKASTPLLTVARRYSEQMVRQRFFAHVSPSGSTLVQRVRKSTRYLRGARSWALGENIAWGSRHARDACEHGPGLDEVAWPPQEHPHAPVSPHRHRGHRRRAPADERPAGRDVHDGLRAPVLTPP